MQHLDDGSLQGWLDRERSGLTEEEIEAVADHLASCPECASRAQELDALTDRTATLLAEHVRDEAVPAYREVVGRARALGRSGGGSRWTMSAWAASVAVALGAGWLGNELYRGGTAPMVVPREAVEAEAVRAPEGDVVRPPAAAGAAGEGAGGAGAGPAAAEERAAPAEEAVRRREGPGDAGAAAREVVADEAPASPAPAAAPPPAAPDDLTANANVPPLAAGSAPHADEPRGPEVRGRVVNAESGEPIEAAQVFIADLDVGVLTLQDGSFRLPLVDEDVDAGPLTLTVERIGYRSESRDFAARPGETVTVDFGIEEAALQLDEIIVTGAPSGTQRRAIGNSVSTVSVAVPVSSEDPAFDNEGAWSPRTRAEARATLGFPVASVPDFSISSVEVGSLVGVEAVRVRQSLGPGATLTLFQARAPLSLEGATTPDGRTVSITRRDEVSIIGAAPVPLDSLNAILSRIR